jgi:hypothetical protein
MVETAAELKIPILYHPPGVRDSLEVVQSHPDVAFILAHLGSFASRDWKEHVRAIEAAGRLANLYLDTSSVVFFEYLERAANELPAEKLIFGSDGPLVNSQVELYKVRLLRLPQTKEQLVLGGNILRLLGKQQPPQSSCRTPKGRNNAKHKEYRIGHQRRGESDSGIIAELPLPDIIRKPWPGHLNRRYGSAEQTGP